MKVYTYSKARQKLADVLEESRTEEVVIKRRKGDMYLIVPRSARSPFDIPRSGIKTRVTRKDILDMLKDSRARAVGILRSSRQK